MRNIADILVLALVLSHFAQADAVPSSLLERTGDAPLTFVKALAEASVPAGVEIRDADAHVGYKRFNSSGETRTVSKQEIVVGFNRQHQDYTASLADGVIVIRPKKRTEDYLDRPSIQGQLSGVGLLSVAEQLFVPLDARLGQPGGRTGSILGPVGEAIDRADDVPISVGASGRTVLQVLNEITSYVHGHPWMVVIDDATPPRIMRFGFVHSRGTTSEISIGS